MPCSKYPCQNGGSCVDLDPINYKCFCKTNYYGYNCEYNQSILYNFSLREDFFKNWVVKFLICPQIIKLE